MAKDPAFLFYPGDYLRDTQCLSEPAQVAYDRIMCEHMRNICISQDRLNFFTKRLTPDQKFEVESVLTKVDGGYQITWVAESIEKRRDYSESRRQNRSKPKKTSSSYDSHMENENVIEDENEKGKVLQIVSRESEDEQKGPKPLEQDEFKPLSDAWFNYIFDENYLSEKAMTFREHDIGGQLKKFKSKVIGAPGDYIYRDTDGIRKAFDYQLRNSKPDKQYKNGRATNKRSSDAVIEPGREFGSFG